jgi:hypothetical protein
LLCHARPLPHPLDLVDLHFDRYWPTENPQFNTNPAPQRQTPLDDTFHTREGTAFNPYVLTGEEES